MQQCGCTVYYNGDAQEDQIRQCPLCAAAPELLEACKAQHQAIDMLFALLVRLDRSFFPSKSSAWSAIVQGNAAIEKAKGRS